jgi:hypothetical protein
MQSESTHSAAPSGRIDTAAGPIRNIQDVFSNWCRRAILYHLQDRDDSVPLEAVTRQLLEWSADETTQPDPVTLERQRSRLRWAHVSEMAKFGLLGYDPATDTVWIPGDVSIHVTPPENRPDEPADLERTADSTPDTDSGVGQ